MNPLVIPLWLSERLSDPDLVVLDATLPPVGVAPPIDTHARYLAKHIPGAIVFDIDALSDHSMPLHREQVAASGQNSRRASTQAAPGSVGGRPSPTG